MGSWTVLNSPGELARLDLGRTDDDLRSRVQSIPNPWARLLLFRLALKDPKHPARRLVENEVLDAFQFLWSAAERPNAPLRFDHVRVAELVAAAERLSSERAEWWARALTELLPARSRTGKQGFESIVVVSAGGRPIIATSPFTILFTAEDAPQSPRDISGPYFRYASGDDARILAERPFAFQRYIAQVVLPQMENHDALLDADSDAHALQNEMKRWLQEQVQQCRRAAGSNHLAHLEPPSNNDWRAAAATLGLEEVSGLTGALRLYTRKAGADMQESEWMLRSTRRRGSLPLVLRPSSFNGRYYPGAASVSLPSNLEASDRDTLPQTATRYPWVYPEQHWFTDQLLVLAEPLERANLYGFANFRSLYTGEKEYLREPRFTIPLRREVLEFFTAEEIENRLSIDVQPSGHVEVTLRVPIGPEQRELSIKRTYDETAFFHEATGPALTLWPRFKSEQWKDYTLFRRDENPNIAQFISIHGVLAGEVLAEDSEQRNELARVSSFDQAPEALEFTNLITGGSKPKRLGIVLPRYGKSQSVGPAQWRVGVDFGTSNTVVSIQKVNGNAPVVLQADELTLSLTRSSAQTRSLLDAYFMPDTLAPRPFGTAVVRFEPLRTHNIHDERIGVRVNVPFNGHVQADKTNCVAGDLKWSAERHTRFLTQAFLRHVLAVVLAQAVEQGVDPRHVHVVWSYPRAFGHGQLNQLDEIWKQVRLYFSERLGGIGPIERGVDESRAVLQFFANEQTITTAGDVNVIVDVGGGTSDIAMYGHGHTIVLDSVMFGGRNLTGPRDWAGTAGSQRNAFVARLLAWAEDNSLADYPIEHAAVLKYLDDEQDHLAFTYLLQSKWFERHGAPFSGEVTAHRFQTLVLYLFGSLAYYVGLSLRSPAARDRSKNYTPAAIMLAGNGSQYMHWLTDLARVDVGVFGEVLGRLTLAGLGAIDGVRPPTVTLTHHPKREVALGLVPATIIKGVDASVETGGSVAGESFKAKLGDRSEEREFTPSQPLRSVDMLLAGQVAELQWADGEMEIERFHNAFSREIERVAGYGQQWSVNVKAIRALLGELSRPDLQQMTKARLHLLASKDEGFRGSLFVVEASAVASAIRDRFFGTPATPARGLEAVART